MMMQLVNRYVRPTQQLPPRRRITKEKARRILIAGAGGIVLLMMSFSVLSISHERHYEHALAPELKPTIHAPVDGDTVARAAAVARAGLEDNGLGEENTVVHSAHESEGKASTDDLKLEQIKEPVKRIEITLNRDGGEQGEVSNTQNAGAHAHDNSMYGEPIRPENERHEAIWHHHRDGTTSFVGSGGRPSKNVGRGEGNLHDGDNVASTDSENGDSPTRESDSMSNSEKTLSRGVENSPLSHGEDSSGYSESTTTRLYGDGDNSIDSKNESGGNISTDGGPSNVDGDYFSGARGIGTSSSGIDSMDSDGSSVERLTTRDFGVAFGIAVAHSAVVPAGERAHLSSHDVTTDRAYRRLVRTGQLGELVARYADALENAAAGGDESLVYVRHHKLYAARSLPAGTVLGEYGGRYMRSSQVASREYWWDLPEMLVNGSREAWGIDAAEWGNALRFCNDLGPGSWNVHMKYVPWNGHWHVVYETVTPVLENEELSISFGANYWAARRGAQ